MVGDGDDDGVRVSAEFISDSRAAGCLLVFEGPSTSSPDIFRAVHRPQLEQGYTVALPLSTYTVYGYDIEEDELPNSIPAVVLDRLTLTHSTSKTCVRTNIFTQQMPWSHIYIAHGNYVCIKSEYTRISMLLANNTHVHLSHYKSFMNRKK